MHEPTTNTLTDLMSERKLSVDGFLDILEKKLENDPENVVPEDLHDLWRSGRISDEECVEHEKSWYDSVEDLPDDVESLHADYGQEVGAKVG